VTYQQRVRITALLFLLPTIVGLVLFRLVPIGWAFALSFYEWQIFDKAEFVGLANYAHIIQSPLAQKILWQSVLYTLLYVPGALVLALVLAVVLNQSFRFSGFFRTAFFVPYITATVAITLAWRWMFSTRFGVINNVLDFFGVDGPAWLADPFWALPAVALVSIQTIDPTLYEAARVDGARPVRRFFRITVPLLSRSLFFVLIIALIRSSQTFEITYALTSGGPNRASTTLAFFIYENAFIDFNMGYASALSYILCVALGFFTLVNFYFRKRWVHE